MLSDSHQSDGSKQAAARCEYDISKRYQKYKENRQQPVPLKLDDDDGAVCKTTASSPALIYPTASYDSSRSDDLLYGSESIIDLFVPITICMSAVVATISSVTFFTEGDVYL